MSETRVTENRRVFVLAAIFALSIFPLLLVVPTLRPSDPSVVSAAALQGYNTVLAYQVALVWCFVALGAAAWLGRTGWLPATDPARATDGRPDHVGVAQRWIERALVGGVVVVALWPPFLARYGPYIEDSIFATALHRMQGGMLPYRDFEFLYGPLMLVPASWFMRAVGYSLQHYYAYLTIVEVVQYVLLVALLQRLVPNTRARLVLFALLVAFLMNPLLGLNYNGVRRLLPLGALLLLTVNPQSISRASLAGAILGLAVAYAHDYSLGAAFAVVGLYAVLFVREPGLRAVLPGLTVGVVALATWLSTAYLLLGDAFPMYISDTRSLVARFSAGEAGFRFYWTANSAAAFSLLALGLVIAGRGIATPRAKPREPLTWGDSFFLCAVLATMLSLKSGLNRSDVWHLDGAFFPVCAAFLLPLPRRAMRWSRTANRVAFGLVAVVGFTHVLGNAPTAAYIAEGWRRGLSDVLAHRVTTGACAADSPAPCIENERGEPRADLVALGQWLAAPAQRNRRVLLYGELWGLGPRLGVYRRDRINDDFIYEDARGDAEGAFVMGTPDAIVVMAKPWHQRLFAAAGEDTIGGKAPFTPSIVKSAGEYLASVHYRGVVVERPLAELRWRRTVGRTIRSSFVRDTAFGDFVVLTRRSNP